MIARLMSVPSRHLKAGRKFVVNHPLTILRGTVAALFSHSYGSPLGIAAVLPDARGSRGSGCNFMGRTVPSADPSTVWLADLIEAAEVLAASAKLCDPAIVRAFSLRLEMPGLPLLPSEVP
jgi:hypothetical protein